jgi:ABC-type Co2+ transport system permease subunit
VSTLDTASYVVAVGNVSSMILVGPLVMLWMRRMGCGYGRILAVSLLGWAALFTAQIVMWRIFGYQAGYPGFRDIQWLALPVSAANLTASLWMARQAKTNERTP